MDITAIGSKMMDLIKKYRYVLLVLVIGIGLMLLPDGSKKNQSVQEAVSVSSVPDTAQELEQILCQIKGAGKVQVFLTQAAGEKILYQTDRDSSTSSENNSVRLETVIITNGERAQQGLVQQVLPPEYRGAIVVCQGAEDPVVRLAIVEAVSRATGLPSSNISVLKMK